MTNKAIKVTKLYDDLENELNEIMNTFDDFTDGTRMLLMLQRKKDGGHNKEERRVFESYVTQSTEEFKIKLRNLLWLKKLYTQPVRIYLSANQRSQEKIIREMHQALVESYYVDDECRNSINKKLIKSPRHYVMQPRCKSSSLFLIDVDDEEGVDVMGGAIRQIAELDVEEVMRYKTKNGWHIVVQPFNPSLWDDKFGEVKKDPLLLLSY